MEETGGTLVYPTFEQVVRANRRMVATSGGYFIEPRNLSNENSLHYILEAIRSPSLAPGRYPGPVEKAAGLAYNIITRHVFVDGNKRTAIHVAWAFLQANGVDIFLDDSVIDLALRVATSDATEEDVINWLREHTS